MFRVRTVLGCTLPLIVGTLLHGAATGVSMADSFDGPIVPRVFASASGAYGFKVIPAEKPWGLVKSTGVLFTLDDKCDEKVIWRKDLVNHPNRVYVSDGGQVVTTDGIASHGYGHVLVLYDKIGKVVADFKLEDLLDPEEISKHVKKTVSNRWWLDAEPRFSWSFQPDERPLEGYAFDITLKWGRKITLEIASGKVKKTMIK